MAEPVSSTTAGIAIAAGTITLTGSIFGVQYEALLAGFCGGLAYLTYVPAVSKIRIAATLAASATLAGYIAPIFTTIILHYLPWLAQAGEPTLRIGIAAAIGLAWQKAWPNLLSRLFPKKGAK